MERHEEVVEKDYQESEYQLVLYRNGPVSMLIEETNNLHSIMSNTESSKGNSQSGKMILIAGNETGEYNSTVLSDDISCGVNATSIWPSECPERQFRWMEYKL
jgi:hypothetical protein